MAEFRIAHAPGQFYPYRVFLPPYEEPASSSGSFVGMSSDYPSDALETMAEYLRTFLTGQGYPERDAHAVHDEWAYDCVKVMGRMTHYFGFRDENHAVNFKLKFEGAPVK